jgi:hypothetical protein
VCTTYSGKLCWTWIVLNFKCEPMCHIWWSVYQLLKNYWCYEMIMSIVSFCKVMPFVEIVYNDSDHFNLGSLDGLCV